MAPEATASASGAATSRSGSSACSAKRRDVARTPDAAPATRASRATVARLEPPGRPSRPPRSGPARLGASRALACPTAAPRTARPARAVTVVTRRPRRSRCRFGGSGDFEARPALRAPRLPGPACSVPPVALGEGVAVSARLYRRELVRLAGRWSQLRQPMRVASLESARTLARRIRDREWLSDRPCALVSVPRSLRPHLGRTVEL